MSTAHVGIVYNQNCPLKCNFCCHTTEIMGRGKFEPHTLIPKLIPLLKSDRVTSFGFSGGEPLLYFSEITQLVSDLRDAGIKKPLSIVTSAAWARNHRTARRKLTKLKAIGLTNLVVSYDAEHARWVERGSILSLVDLCEEFGIALTVTGVFWNMSESVKSMLPELPNWVHTTNFLAAPIGRAERYFSNDPKFPELDAKTKNSCGMPGHYELAIYPGGNVYPCCSGGFNLTGKMECGNLFQDEPEDILDEVFVDPGAGIAKEIGFEEFAAAAKLLEPESAEIMPKLSEVDSACEVCRVVNLKRKEGHFKLTDAHFQKERVLKRLRHVA